MQIQFYTTCNKQNENLSDKKRSMNILIYCCNIFVCISIVVCVSRREWHFIDVHVPVNHSFFLDCRVMINNKLMNLGLNILQNAVSLRKL